VSAIAAVGNTPTVPIPQTHENHEPAIHDFAMRRTNPLRKINTVPADGLPVQQTAASGLTTQEKHDDMGKTDSLRYAFWL
jgi:hypothetical protein